MNKMMRHRKQHSKTLERFFEHLIKRHTLLLEPGSLSSLSRVLAALRKSDLSWLISPSLKQANHFDTIINLIALIYLFAFRSLLVVKGFPLCHRDSFHSGEPPKWHMRFARGLNVKLVVRRLFWAKLLASQSVYWYHSLQKPTFFD